MFDVDDSRLSSIASKYEVKYSEVFDKVIHKQREIFFDDVKSKISNEGFINCILYIINYLLFSPTNKYDRATKAVEMQYEQRLLLQNVNVEKYDTKSKYLVQKDMKKTTINDIVNV
jgi:hypothetical protein